jgi:hypothetical protein
MSGEENTPSVRFAPGPSLRNQLGEDEQKHIHSVTHGADSNKGANLDVQMPSRAAFDPHADKKLLSTSASDPLEKFKALPDSMTIARKKFDGSGISQEDDRNAPAFSKPLPASMSQARARPNFNSEGYVPGPKQSPEVDLADSPVTRPSFTKPKYDLGSTAGSQEMTSAALSTEITRKSFNAPKAFGTPEAADQSQSALNVDITRKSFAKPQMNGQQENQQGMHAALDKHVERKNFSVDKGAQGGQGAPDYFGAADAALNGAPRRAAFNAGGMQPQQPAQAAPMFASPPVRANFQPSKPRAILD